MKIVIPGGSGELGTLLARAFGSEGHEVVVLSRRSRTGPWRVVEWDGVNPGAWTAEVDGCDAVINLAGRSVNCRYTAENRREILQSRVLSTRAIGRAIQAARQPPQVWVQASTATIYAHRYDAPNDERTGLIGGGEPNVPETWRFSIEVAKAWEQAATECELTRTRNVLMRSAIVISPLRGGTFELLLRLVRLGLGGREGNGRQFVSWIHHEDWVRAVEWLVEHREIDGAVNLASPEPLPNGEFMRALRRAAGMPIGLPATRWMLEAGALVIRTETELVLKSRRVVPTRLVESGFDFHFPVWPVAAKDLVRRKLSRA
jgi:uncharacterized protein (TIGR01777 family)